MIYLLIYLATVGIFLWAVHNYNEEGRHPGLPDRFDWSGWWPKLFIFMPVFNTIVLVLAGIFVLVMTFAYRR